MIFALVNPPIGKITLYNFIFPGRLRFPYEDKPSFDFVGYDIPVLEDFDAMFGTHVISKRKSADEFRLVLLGDSATWGFGLPADQALSEQINRLHIQTCDGRIVRAYNLAYPFSFLRRDLLILDKTIEYQPDMVFWIITLSTLEPKTEETPLVYILSTTDKQSSSFTPPQKWSKTVARIKPSTGKLALSAKLVTAVPMRTKGCTSIILKRK